MKSKEEIATITNILKSGGALKATDYIGAGLGVASTVASNIAGNNPVAPEAPTFETANEVEDLFAAGQEWDPIYLGRKKGGLQALAGGIQGAATGMSAGPWGALAGGVLGGITGLFGARKYNKKAKKEEAKYSQNSANNFNAKNELIESNNLANAAMNYAAYGGEFDNGLIEFNTGNSHESNPNGGIMQGIGSNGKPNLVEQGETKFDNYIFSDRLKMDIVDPQSFKLPKKYKGKTFANISKRLGAESKERPYDPISINGLRANLAKLRSAQEAVKHVNAIDQENNQALANAGLSEQLFAEGGDIHIKPSKKGTFTAAATKHGMSVAAFANEVLSHKKNYSPTMVKKANFARNAANWHSLGGLNDIGNIFDDGGDEMPYYSTNYSPLFGYWPYFKGANVRVPFLPQSTTTTKSTTGRSNRPAVVTPKKTNTPYQTTVELFTPKASNQLSFPNLKDGTKSPYISPIAANDALEASMNEIETTTQGIHSNYIDNLNRLASERNSGINEYLRYAPVLTNLGTTIANLSEEPETVSYGRIRVPRRGRYASMEYFDRNPIINAMTRRTNTTIDNLKNSSAGNRATFMANAALTGNQSQINIGDALQKIQEDEYNRKLKVLAFNNSVDTAADKNRLYADIYNQRAAIQEAQLNSANRAAARNAAREGISTLGTTLGQIGKEGLDRFTISNMFGYDYLGRPTNREDNSAFDKLSKRAQRRILKRI